MTIILTDADAAFIQERIASAQQDIADTDAYIRNALEVLAEARSTVIDHLTLPSDMYTKANILLDLGSVEDNLRKALA